jgi:hypothetical protein
MADQLASLECSKIRLPWTQLRQPGPYGLAVPPVVISIALEQHLLLVPVDKSAVIAHTMTAYSSKPSESKIIACPRMAVISAGYMGLRTNR